MAGRLWTKGVAWKKTALKLINDSNTGPFLANGQNGNTFHKYPETSSFELQQSKPFSMVALNNNIFLENISSSKFTNSVERGKFNIIPKLGIHSTLITFDDKSNATIESSNSPEGAKVGIISSMFEDGNKQKSTDPVPEQPEEKQDDSDGKDGEEKRESPFLRSQRIAKWMLLGSFVITTPLLVAEFGPPKRDEYGDIMEDEFSKLPVPIAYMKRAWSELKLVEKDIVEPSSQKLLPDPLEEPYYQPPYTLVIELFDVLLHPVYDQVHGWRFKKRPGIEYFLSQVGPPLYEIVIFTRETGMTAFPLIDSMDPKGYIMYRLFRDAARFKSGFTVGNIFKGEWPKLDPYYQKDLKYLNRDLNRVVVVDNDRRATELQPSNGISLKPWDGTVTDTELFDLAAFLRTIATNEVDDVRPVLEHYRKYEDPLAAFKLAQTRMQEEQDKLAKQIQEGRIKSIVNPQPGGFNMLTKYFKAK